MFMAAVKDPLYRYPEAVYTNAGICAHMRPDPELADSYFRKALQANPKYPPALRQMVKSSFLYADAEKPASGCGWNPRAHRMGA